MPLLTLWAYGLIVVFILFPLLSMLQASVIIQGHLTTAALRQYLTSPIFLLLRHPELPTDPIRWGTTLGIAAAAHDIAQGAERQAAEIGRTHVATRELTASVERVADAARASRLVVMEAFHWRYHPLAARLLARCFGRPVELPADTGDLAPLAAERHPELAGKSLLRIAEARRVGRR